MNPPHSFAPQPGKVQKSAAAPHSHSAVKDSSVRLHVRGAVPDNFRQSACMPFCACPAKAARSLNRVTGPPKRPRNPHLPHRPITGAFQMNGMPNAGAGRSLSVKTPFCHPRLQSPGRIRQKLLPQAKKQYLFYSRAAAACLPRSGKDGRAPPGPACTAADHAHYTAPHAACQPQFPTAGAGSCRTPKIYISRT